LALRLAAVFLAEACLVAALPLPERLNNRSPVSDTSCLTSPNARCTGFAGFLRRRPVACDTRARTLCLDLAIILPLVRFGPVTRAEPDPYRRTQRSRRR